ncbi:hypothetical protein [Paenibacillus apiarius]|uniref:Uncharacterized protein n=1 Tax=Paenibacillus apiarius TaxID=46240 RepID=A0ABT4E1A3_9BACL|nr:hypothetical protein [Paenibacillus apiarius]MCY9517913.1 hypothetical protein [Paenibacillus apiarius]MCY9523382.1 hypothetical protein [Paenibacillus apiarius]MCY9555559.1 hypothetical protein [Paenibacillus apiarius]MCY9561566.1 hypothetical protein [Paenibacillus apiarius]MCY9687159.1 hypothetical protein [Paenibacillus apiarius]
MDPSGYSSQSVGCGGGGKKEGPFGKTGKPDFSKHHDYVAHDGYYNRKEFRSNIAKAESSEHGFKHIKAKTEDEAIRFSETGDKNAQYLPTIKNKVLEREALQKGLIFQDRKKGAIYFFYNVGKKVGYDLGDETTWIRAELTSGGVYHGHPISSKRLSKYIDKALTRAEFFKKILRE